MGYNRNYNITNVTQLYCDGRRACEATTITNGSNIQVNGTNVLDGATIISGAWRKGTMTMTIHSGATGNVSIICQTGDTGVIA